MANIVELRKIVLEISNNLSLSNIENFDQSINQILEKVGCITHVDRTYICFFSDDKLFFTKTYEWSKLNIEFPYHFPKGKEIESNSWFVKRLKKPEPIIIASQNNFWNSSLQSEEIRTFNNSKSLLILPLFKANELTGFMGFDSVQTDKSWEIEEISFLGTIGLFLNNSINHLFFSKEIVGKSADAFKYNLNTNPSNDLDKFSNFIFDKIDVGIIVIDSNGVIQFISSFVEKLLGYTSKIVLGRYSPLFFHDESDLLIKTGKNLDELDKFGSPQFNLLSRLRLNKPNTPSEWIYRKNDGEKVKVIISINEIADEKGKTQETVITFFEAPNLNYANEGVKTNFEGNGKVLNSSIDLIFKLNKDGIFIDYQNPLNHPLLVGPDLFLGKSILEVLPDAIAQKSFEALMDCFQTKEIVRFNYSVYIENKKYYFENRFFSTNETEALSFIRDVTEEKIQEDYSLILRDLAFKLATTDTIETLFELISDSLMQLGDVDVSGIYLLNRVEKKLELIVSKVLSSQLIANLGCYHEDEEPYKLVLKGEPIYEFVNLPKKESELFVKENIVYTGMIPIHNGNQIIGSVNFASKNKPFSLLFRSFCETMISQIGGTLARIESVQTLKVNAENFRILFNARTDFIIVTDLEGKIIVTNPFTTFQLEYSEEELLFSPITRIFLIDPKSKSKESIAFWQMLSRKLDFSILSIFSKNGKRIPVETKVFFNNWNGKEAIYWRSHDISERLNSEKRIMENEQRWQFALEGSDNGVWDWNILENVVFYSDYWKRMLGYEPHEISNSFIEWESRVHPDDLRRSLLKIKKVLENKNIIYKNEFRIRCKDNIYKWVLARGKVVEWTSEGLPKRLIGTHSDITRKKILEENLAKTLRKEKELNEFKSRFVSTTSHEFRTPLASILMNTDTLLLFYEKITEEQRISKLKKIKGQVRHLTAIVNDVLLLSKLQEKKIPVNLKSENIILLCRTVLQEFHTNYDAEDWLIFKANRKKLMIDIDQRLFTQILNNLISNAIKYSQDNPRIVIQLKKLDNEFTLSVSDNGIGIPLDDQTYLFQPFYRASNVSTIQGNGLGLSIINESVSLLQGSIELKSILGKGTQILLHFPLLNKTETPS